MNLHRQFHCNSKNISLGITESTTTTGKYVFLAVPRVMHLFPGLFQCQIRKYLKL